MQKFCPQCDATVTLGDTEERCPTCHRSLANEPRIVAETQKKPPLLALGAVIALAGAGVAIAASAGLSLPARAGTIEDARKRGTFRVGVTQAPPWFSKDP